MSAPFHPPASRHEEKATESLEKREPVYVPNGVVERRLRTKIDFYLIPVVCLTYISAFIDRIAIGNARVAGIEGDLGMHGYDYNIALSLFFVSYTVFEIPCILLCKKMGPSRYIPICTILFGLLAMCTAFVRSFGALCAVRFLLGIPEAAMLPGISYYLSRFYRKDELVFRLGLYIVCAPLGGAFGGLLASGILNIDSIGSVTSWRQIFLVEGIITMGIGLIALCLMPETPGTMRWLQPDQRKAAEARVLADQFDRTKLIDGIGWKRIVNNIFETQTLLSALQFLFNNITVQGVAVFTPTIVATIFPDETGVGQNLRTVPPYIAGAASALALPYLSWKFKQRGIFLLFASFLTIIGYAMFVGSDNARVRYGASFITMAGAFPYCSLVNAWISANSVSDTGKAVSIATVGTAGSLGGLISTWSYLPSDAPDYRTGNSLNLGTSTAIACLVVTTLLWMRWQNRKKDAIASFDSISIQSNELALGRKHPGYRYQY